MKKVLLLFMFVFIFILTGCEGLELSEKINSITINGSQKLYIGDEATYEAIFDPIDYHNQEVIWSSSDESKLTINQETGLAIALNETNEEGVFIYATSKAESNNKGSKKVFIYKPDYHDPVYPDLQGYTITIAQSETNLCDINPFLESYAKDDKKYKQEAWREVEKDFNCKIEVKPYPSSAAWGPSRWDYILTQAENKTSDYDFLIVPDNRVYQFANAKAILSLEDFYVLYGNNMMDKSFIESGTYNNELYTFSPSMNSLYYAMYYNINLFKQLQEINQELIEPAQIFLDGNWTYSKFLEYCIEVQETMKQLYGDKGTAGSENQQYYAMSGWDAYLWTGLASSDGEPIIDVKNSKHNLLAPHKEQAADIVKELYSSRYADPLQSYNIGVKSWREGRAFFTSGHSIMSAYLEKKDFNVYGEFGYGYVPWPRPDDVKFEDIKVALGGNPSSFVMPIGRNYEGYGNDCTAENIYWALTEVYKRTQEKMNKIDIEPSIPYNANKFTDSESSQAAFIYIHDLIAKGEGYFDPMVAPVDELVLLVKPSGYHTSTTIKSALARYTSGEVETWNEAIAVVVAPLVEIIKNSFYK